MRAAEAYEDVQHGMDGYDPDHYFEMALTVPGHPVNTRSNAAKFISREVNKLVNVPLLKDHASAGVTLALKNLSHGHVNYVARSHSTRTLNAAGRSYRRRFRCPRFTTKRYCTFWMGSRRCIRIVRRA
jgi:hypothetical protein